MDAFARVAIAIGMFPVVALGIENVQPQPIDSVAPTAESLAQPDWLRPHRTVRLAQLPKRAGESSNVGDLLSDVGTEQQEPPFRIRDDAVGPATAQLLAHDPQQVQGLLNEARALAKRSTELADFDRVLDLCHQAIEAGPTPAQAAVLGRFGAWASNARGECLLELGNEHAAFEAFQEAVLLDDTCWEALHNRAVTLAANNKPQQALADFARVVEMEPKFASAYRNRGELYTSLGQDRLALDDFTHAIRYEPSVASHRYARALAHRQLGRLADSVKDLNMAVRLDANDPSPFVLRADIYQSLGYWEQSLDDYQRALDADPRSLTAYRGLAWLMATCPNAHYRNGEKAVEAARRAHRLGDQNDPSLLDILAAAHAEAGDFQAAIPFVEQAIVLTDPNKAGPLHQRLQLYRSGKPYRATTP